MEPYAGGAAYSPPLTDFIIGEKYILHVSNMSCILITHVI
ncbi:hypothetical protein OTUT144_0349 [Orientia tsutsugamushi str. UT144]|uniref:Uncharacterized protein n=1 Tax=Orientia tsutsugamushi str. UT144 TaxID=1441384 RepID=A0A0F3RML8_ORITS|nr:hypothetical protein OTUT144_0349 [Orientia tsutsugamushi str. UT144]